MLGLDADRPGRRSPEECDDCRRQGTAGQATRWRSAIGLRRLSPFPGAYTFFNGRRLKIYSTRAEPEFDHNTPLARPGQVISVTQEGFLVQTGKGTLHILQVQKEGKNRMSGFELAQGIPDITSRILGE